MAIEKLKDKNYLEVQIDGNWNTSIKDLKVPYEIYSNNTINDLSESDHYGYALNRRLWESQMDKDKIVLVRFYIDLNEVIDTIFESITRRSHIMEWISVKDVIAVAFIDLNDEYVDLPLKNHYDTEIAVRFDETLGLPFLIISFGNSEAYYETFTIDLSDESFINRIGRIRKVLNA